MRIFLSGYASLEDDGNQREEEEEERRRSSSEIHEPPPTNQKPNLNEKRPTRHSFLLHITTTPLATFAFIRFRLASGPTYFFPRFCTLLLAGFGLPSFLLSMRWDGMDWI
jgi:hypothetical protein